MFIYKFTKFISYIHLIHFYIQREEIILKDRGGDCYLIIYEKCH